MKIDLKDKKTLFLNFTVIVPIILMIITSMIMGAKIRTMWMTPFYLFFGTLFIYIFKTQINFKKYKSFIFIFIIFFILSPLSYAYISITQNDKRTDYRGKEIARNLEKFLKKEEQFKFDKILFIQGNEWVAGNLCYHLKFRPKCIISPGQNSILLLVKSKDQGELQIQILNRDLADIKG